jgi:hypothetical protein
MFKIMAFFVVVSFVLLYVTVGILLTYGKYLNDRIISLRGEVWAHETSLKPRHFLLKYLYQIRKVSGMGLKNKTKNTPVGKIPK